MSQCQEWVFDGEKLKFFRRGQSGTPQLYDFARFSGTLKQLQHEGWVDVDKGCDEEVVSRSPRPAEYVRPKVC